MSTGNTALNEDGRLLEVRAKIYPRAVTGVFARWRWAMVWLTQLVFYGTPWLSWPLFGDTARQAVLFDLGARKFHIFGLILYPQDFIYLTGLLIISALSLFLFTTIAGRLWCGYACPQTVYTEIFLWIERKIEGDRGRRMKLDAAPWSLNKLRTKATKHVVWILVALWTGITFVGYFTPIRELVPALFRFALSPWELFWVGFYALATWGNAGFLREQVCKYMCPYARFQGVMFDKDTWVITYDPYRGEPRKPRGRKDDKKALGIGDCIDCGLCVQVCPTGIDIRDGQQYECIGCAACIDACDKVMDKVGYPKGLIRYDTLAHMDTAAATGVVEPVTLKRVFRPRVILYSVILLTLVTVLFTHMLTRTPLKVDVMRDRGALSREVKNGYIENIYQLQISNSAERAQEYTIEVNGLPGLLIDSPSTVEVGSASHRLLGVRVRTPPNTGESGSNPIEFVVQSTNDADIRQTSKATFFVP